MLKYILKRLALMLFTFFIIITICFFLIKLLPNELVMTPGKDYTLILERRKAFGYDKPLIEQYFIFLNRSFLHGDWGIGEVATSPTYNKEVLSVFMERLPNSMYVNLWAALISVPIGLGFGILAALRKNKIEDHIISTVVMIFISVPSYVVALLVQYIFCFKLKWFPATMAPADAGYFTWTMFSSVIPAILSLCFGTIAGLTRYTRAELTEVLTSEYMLLARTKGLTKAQAIKRHALRNAMVPIFPMIIGEFISIISGSLIIEQVFSIPGVGKLYITAINSLDYNLFMLDTCFYTFIGLLSGIVVDISYGIIDPRIRMGAK